MGLNPLNWKELKIWVDRLKPEVEGRFVDRLIVPARARFPQGFLKGEWAMRLTGRGTSDRCLILSCRPRKPTLYLIDGKGPQAALQATHSGFDLAANKHLKGAKLVELSCLPQERMIVLRFRAEQEYALFLALIPALPELSLATRGSPSDEWILLARTRNLALGPISLPDGSKAPLDLRVRDELVSSLKSYREAFEKDLDEDAFDIRARAAERTLRDHLKQSKKRSAASDDAVAGALQEPDYQRYGDQLKCVLYQNPAPLDRPGKRFWSVPDFETGEPVEIEGSPQLTACQQTERYYHLEKRKRRRIDDGTERALNARKLLERFEKLLLNFPKKLETSEDWVRLETMEAALGIANAPGATPKERKTSGKALWFGRTFRSKDGQVILVGKSKDENLELTFKIARGNDMWLHVKGRPGAHVVVPIQPGKNASLETLLDAAVLAVFYSGGESWGKTEVDYTLKKYVKRIKDSSEASYTQNKTLIVQPEADRLKRLLGQQEQTEK